jgi:hypothetical protein
MANLDHVYEGADILDSRDIIKKIEYLEADEDTLDADDLEELNALRSLAQEAESSPDWQYGETLIAESYFQDYAEQLASDIGAISDDAKWPLTHIDWEAAAEELKQDYRHVEYRSTTYYIRA